MNKKFKTMFLRMMLVSIFFLLTQTSVAFAGAQIVINKATNQLSYWKDGNLLKTFPVATGRHPSYTPEGNFSIVVKVVDPYYGKLNIPGGSPSNPLGCRWLGLSIGGGSVYGIHGTNNPASIGTYASAGCIRMHNKDVMWLYDNTPLGTPVKITSTSVASQPKPKPQPVTLVINDIKKPIEFPAGASLDGSPLLPLRTVFNELGYTVLWDGAKSTIDIIKNNKKISIACNTKQVRTGQTLFICNELKEVNGATYAPWSLWQKTLQHLQIGWDAQQHLLIFKNMNAESYPGNTFER